MYKLLVIVTCIVVLTIHWTEFSEIVNLIGYIKYLTKILETTTNIITEVKE